ncbi:hypothetical protein ACVH9Z_23960 [Rhodococcus opacus]|uniref:hypothetical protein n=1 Tax=Rhodococcus opacus TaxID=37919 RepID=UPI001F57BE3D|nr:hypothetical protein [Rhodococcus opacus]UNN01120.1 hypothetical protein MOO23_00785 [Rhodococcus opacus]
MDAGRTLTHRIRRNTAMLTTMMERPLLTSSLLWHAENVFADRVGLSCDAGRGDREFTYRDLGAATPVATTVVATRCRLGTWCWPH